MDFAYNQRMTNVFADLLLPEPAQLRARAAICARLRADWIAPDQVTLPELLGSLRETDRRFEDPALDRKPGEDAEAYGDRLYAAISRITADA